MINMDFLRGTILGLICTAVCILGVELVFAGTALSIAIGVVLFILSVLFYAGNLFSVD